MKKLVKELIEFLLENNIQFVTQFYIEFMRIDIIEGIEEYCIIINDKEVVIDNEFIGKTETTDFRDIIVSTIGTDKIDI